MAMNDALTLGLVMTGLLVLGMSWMAWSARGSANQPKQPEAKASSEDGEAPTPRHRGERKDRQNAREQPHHAAA